MTTERTCTCREDVICSQHGTGVLDAEIRYAVTDEGGAVIYAEDVNGVVVADHRAMLTPGEAALLPPALQTGVAFRQPPMRRVPPAIGDRLGRGLAAIIPQRPTLADLSEPLRQKVDDALDRAVAELIAIDRRMVPKLPAPPAGYHWTSDIEDQTDVSTNTYRMRIVYRLEADS